MSTYSIVTQTRLCVCPPDEMMGKHSCHNDGSVRLGHASASGKDTVKAVNSPQVNVMLVDVCANCGVTVEIRWDCLDWTTVQQ